MYRYFQPNLGGINTIDCPVRAICAVTGFKWETVHEMLCDLSRRMYDMPNSDRVWWELLRRLNFAQVRLLDRCPDCYTVADFAADHPKGQYILGPFEHAVAVVDGDWLDSWDSGDTVPMYYFRRKI